ncbi:TetR/AcrR family transcriptional regulator [Paenibacillus sp. 1P07SE]|uniref:TetR/AcrR family transcriptional regulator n=1 Tax=Paenibacillus sp. 1P07SE TaxID=3132209 RepID=UPI0039A63C5D
MPKIVDHDHQRQRVVEAALRIIRSDGIEGATVRKIAAEAGLSVGSMRHYFNSQLELFSWAMHLFLDRIETRIRNTSFDGPPLESMVLLLLQFMPVDEERRLEMEVWLAFMSKATVHAELQELSDKMHRGLYESAQYVILTLIGEGLARADLDVKLEAQRLHALVDGLSLQHLLQPTALPLPRIEELLSHHLHCLGSGKLQR